MQAKIQLPVIANEEVFEDFVLSLYNLQYPDSHFQFFGKKGNNQKGIDIISTSKGVAIQCKKKETTGRNLLNELKADLKADIGKTLALKLNIHQLIFVSTFNDSAQLIEYLQELKNTQALPFEVSYVGWQSLSSHAQDHSALLKKYFPQFFEARQKRLPVSLPFFDPALLLGRAGLLQEIDELIKKHLLLVIQGIGGIGKTVSLSCYIRDHLEEYDHVIWVELHLESLKEDIIVKIDRFINNKGTPQKKLNWEDCCYHLTTIHGNNLIIIDGIESLEKDTFEAIEDIASTGWRVIIASRVKLPDYPAITVDGLSNQSAKSLFLRYFTREADEEIIEKITTLLENHPLGVELVAKATQANPTLTLQKVYSELVDESVKSSHIQGDIHIGRHSRKYDIDRNQKIFKYLLRCFHISDLTPEEQEQLLYFSVFPNSQPISYDYFIEATGQKQKPAIAIQNAINSIENKGWINNRDGAYYIHPLIQVVVWEKLELTEKKLGPLIEFCTKGLAVSGDKSPWQLMNYISLAKNILQGVGIVPESAFLGFLYATAVTNMGNYKDSIRYFEQILKEMRPVLLEDQSFAASLYNNLGNAYRFTGRFEDAKAALARSIQIHRLAGPDDSVSMAHSLDNYATTLDLLGHYKESIACTKQVIQILKKQKSYDSLSKAYSNLANTYYNLEEFNKAKTYWRKGFYLRSKDSEPEHLSSLYNTMGLILQGQKRFRLAKKAFTKAIMMHAQSPNPDILATSYANLASADMSLFQFEEAKANIQKAEKFNQSIPGGSEYNIAVLNELWATYYSKHGDPATAQKKAVSALEIYQRLLPEGAKKTETIKIFLQRLQSPLGQSLNLSVDLDTLYHALKESLDITNKLFEKTVIKFGDIKGLTVDENTVHTYLHDYILFCFTKVCKSFSSVSILLSGGKPEDAMILLHSIYRIYLLIASLNNHPDDVYPLILTPIRIISGEVEKYANKSGAIYSTAIVDPESNKPISLYPHLADLASKTSYAEDIIIHNYMEVHLSEHVHANFLVSENYRNKQETHYDYKSNATVLQAANIGLYLQVIILKETCLFLQDCSWAEKTDPFLHDNVSLLQAASDIMASESEEFETAYNNRLSACNGYS